MKKKKLENLKVESFITQLQQKNVCGGVQPGPTACICTVSACITNTEP